MYKKRLRKIGAVLSNTLLYLFLILMVLSVAVTIFSKKDTDGAAKVFGYQLRLVVSDSMEKCDLTDVSDYEIKSLPLRSLIFVKLIPADQNEREEWYRNLRVGDVLTFRYVYTTQVTITHRITKITPKSTGGYIIELAGDNKNSETNQLYQTIDTSIPNSKNYVIGKVCSSSLPLGFVLSILKEPLGIIFAIIIPCFIIIILEILKILGAFAHQRRVKAEEEARAKEEELAELRRRLDELEKEKSQKSEDEISVSDEKTEI